MMLLCLYESTCTTRFMNHQLVMLFFCGSHASFFICLADRFSLVSASCVNRVLHVARVIPVEVCSQGHTRGGIIGYIPQRCSALHLKWAGHGDIFLTDIEGYDQLKI